MIFMTRSTENQIKKLLSNPLEETYNIDVPRLPKTRSNPHLNSASTKSAEKSKRTAHQYNTTSPLVKKSEPLQNAKLLTEKVYKELQQLQLPAKN